MVREFQASDRDEYKKMAQEFYESPAVSHKIPLSHFEATVRELLSGSPYAQCLIIEENGITAGYAMLARTFSTEAGGLTIWLDELFIKSEFRGKGLGRELIEQIKRFSDVFRVRLELTPTNSGARRLYESCGFEPLDYHQMVIDLK